MTTAALGGDFLRAFKAGTLTKAQAEVAAGCDPIHFKFLLLQLSAIVAGPSAAKRAGKVGAKPGHPGASRPTPERIDRREEHRLPACPDCGCTPWPTSRRSDRDLRKLKKRLTPSEDLLMFVEVAGVDPTNNKAEREIRPAVLMRKCCYGSMSEPGSVTRSVLMSIYRTLKQRRVDPVSTTAAALRTYAATGTLPPLPNTPSSEA